MPIPSLQRLLSDFLASSASDLHLSAGGLPWIRLHGAMTLLPGYDAFDLVTLSTLTAELVGKEKFEQFERDKELDMAINFADNRLRINLYCQQGKTAWSLRALPKTFFALDQLGLPGQVCDLATSLQKGLVLVTGATGSGKSTTLAAMLNRINQNRPCHIFTIEDPIEYVHENKKAFVSQREVGEDTESFHEALRRVLREDPDVVLIGEMRDRITMGSALTLAETGHLTFATLHTADAVQTVTRIIGSFPANEQPLIRTQLAETLSLIVCQQLVPWKNAKGRSMAAEILVVTPAVRAMIREDKIHQLASVIQTGSVFGMRTMESSLRSLLEKGFIDENTFGALLSGQNRT